MRIGVAQQSAVVLLSLAISFVPAIFLRPFLHDQAQMLPFTLAVILASSYGGLPAGLVTTVLSFVTADFFFTEPRFKLLSVYPDDYAMLLIFVAFGVTVSVLNHARLTANIALRQMNQQLELAAMELARSNKELQRFAHSVAHDLEAPRRVISTFTELFLNSNRSRLDQESTRRLDFVLKAAGQMGRLIAAILEFARAGHEATRDDEIDTGYAAEIAIQQLRDAIEGTGAKISCASLPVLRGDEGQLVRLFQNLIGNAIKYRGKEPVEIQISAVANGREWIFSVRDNGIGIDPQYHGQIFETFQRLHAPSEIEGSGVGLATCKRIVQNHGGSIWVESQPAKGSTFYFTIPKEGQAAGDRVKRKPNRAAESDDQRRTAAGSG